MIGSTSVWPQYTKQGECATSRRVWDSFLSGENKRKWDSLHTWSLIQAWKNGCDEIGRSIIRALTRVMKGRKVTMVVKRGLKYSILLPMLIYGSETWAWNRAQQSSISAVEISYLGKKFRMSRWDGVSKESIYKITVMGTCANKMMWNGGTNKK